MSKQRKKYTKTEKLEIVSLSLENAQSIKELAGRFEISQNSIYRWRSLYLKNKEAAFPGQGNKTMTAPERKIAELEKELKEARLERDILKKAVGIFSKSDKEFSNS